MKLESALTFDKVYQETACFLIDKPDGLIGNRLMINRAEMPGDFSLDTHEISGRMTIAIEAKKVVWRCHCGTKYNQVEKPVKCNNPQCTGGKFTKL